MARENGGAMFYLEHRFYGESIPTSDLSTRNLATHSSRQAIEDIRQFYNWLRTSEFYSKSKLVLMGCSYSASLSMFTKQIYPNMVTAVYATSGPLLSTFDMYQYMEVVTSYIRRVNPQCNNIIMGAIQTMESMYLNGQKDRLHQLFSVCRSSQVQEPLDRAAFFLRFIYHFANMVQSASSTVTSQCQRLTNAQGTTNLDKFVSYFAVPANQCTSGVFAHHPPGFLNTNKDQSSRSWLWQQCNEFGWFITTAGNNQVYGSSVRPSMHYALCRAVFGNAGQSDAQLNAKVTATNSNYNVNPGKGAGLKNIAFLYSSDDPWAPMGYNMLPNSQTRMLRIEGGGHCADMSSSSASDSASMRNAKNTARALIKQWLQ
ncbi:putative serine protease K12H4.7 [Atheta coriaria]|uniref:putative serine protease K12H4.7 n=1 Tax=Dalotia coriaria TaxID=877792 RepID=UPI0031F4780B